MPELEGHFTSPLPGSRGCHTLFDVSWRGGFYKHRQSAAAALMCLLQLPFPWLFLLWEATQLSSPALGWATGV